MSLSKSMCGIFKRNCLELKQFLCFTTPIPTGFYSQKVWGLFLALKPWAGGPGVGLGTLQSYPSQILSTRL